MDREYTRLSERGFTQSLEAIRNRMESFSPCLEQPFSLVQSLSRVFFINGSSIFGSGKFSYKQTSDSSKAKERLANMAIPCNKLLTSRVQPYAMRKRCKRDSGSLSNRNEM